MLAYEMLRVTTDQRDMREIHFPAVGGIFVQSGTRGESLFTSPLLAAFNRMTRVPLASELEGD
jgi:hypothetical protein